MGLLVVVLALLLLLHLLSGGFLRAPTPAQSESDRVLQLWLASAAARTASMHDRYATEEQRLLDLLPKDQQAEAKSKRFTIVKGKRLEWMLNWGTNGCYVYRRRLGSLGEWTRLCVSQYSRDFISGPGVALTMYLWIMLDEEHLYTTANVV